MASKLSVSFNVAPMASAIPRDGRLKVEIKGSENKAIAKHYGLTDGGENNAKLLKAIQMVVQKHKPRNSAIHTSYGNPDDLIEAIGTYVFNKQAQSELKDADLNLVKELYLLLKVARKIHVDGDNPIRFNMFDNFERPKRYHYNDNKTLSGERNKTISESPLKDATAWTSYFKDVLAYESTRDGGKAFDKNNMFNSIEIESVEPVSGNSKSSVNPVGKNGTSRRSADSLDESSKESSRVGKSVSSDSGRPKSDDESVNSNSDLRFTDERKSCNETLEAFIATHEKKVKQKEAAGVRVQARWKKLIETLRQIEEEREAAIKIHNAIWSFQANKILHEKRAQKKVALKLQAILRGRSVRDRVQKEAENAIKLQSVFRGYSAKQGYEKQKAARQPVTPGSKNMRGTTSPTGVAHSSTIPVPRNGANRTARSSQGDVSMDQRPIKHVNILNGLVGRILGGFEYPNQAIGSSPRQFSPTSSKDSSLGDFEMVSLYSVSSECTSR